MFTLELPRITTHSSEAGEISLETETLKRKSRWAADIEFRLTLFEQLEPDQWDAQVGTMGICFHSFSIV
jgi:hypothetical protein